MIESKLAFNMKNDTQVTVIGGGLAGSEAAWQAAERGARVRLYEMRPVARNSCSPHIESGGSRLL